MGNLIAWAIAAAALVALAALCLYFLFIALRTLIIVPLRAFANIRGPAKLTVDPRLATKSELQKLRNFTQQIAQYEPPRTRLPPAPKVPYRSILSFLPYRKVPYFRLEEEPFFFDSERAWNGRFFYQPLTPNQAVSADPNLADLDALQRPSEQTVDILLGEALALQRTYPHTDISAPQEHKPLDLGPFAREFDVPKPKVVLPLWPGPLRILNSFVRTANQDKIAEYRKACEDWRELQRQFDEASAAHAAYNARLASLNADIRAQWENAQRLQAADRAAWESRRNAETELLRGTLQNWQAYYVENPAGLAKLVLEFALFPRWLPMDVAAEFDAEAGMLIVDAQFPDIGQLTWQKTSGNKVKPATKTQAREAGERLYPALALRYAWEVARTSNVNLVKTIVLNGWADYIERTIGATKRAYVTSLLAEVEKLRALNLPAVDVVQAFTALKGVSARAQTVTPVAPIVAMDTNDKRFVDARNVMDEMSSEQNLATMDWGDFEHLCRQLFEKEFASNNSEVKITQASRDQGVDAIIFDRDPIRGGKIIIQAKRYAGTVDVSAVRDLWGTTQHEGAMKGILVTTSNYGSDAYNFANGKPLTLINGGQLLHLLQKHGYSFRINLAEAKLMARERQAGGNST